MGPYFGGDQINVLQKEIKTIMSISTTQFSWLNSLGSLLGILTAPFFGIMMDRFGVEVGL
jgi:hypothetical protein